MAYQYDFLISELRLRAECPRELTIPLNFQPFFVQSSPSHEPDILLQIRFGPAPEDCCAVTERFFWKDGENVIRQEPGRQGEPCRLYIPEGFAADFCQQGNWLLYLGLERMLLPFDRLILHASAVMHQGKVYLFCAPSGGGKSTHAALWQSHYGARLLNGDKVVIHVENGRCTAWGSPVAGSSGIYVNDGAEVAAIFLLQKAKQNAVREISRRNALLALYSEAIKCGTDTAFNTRLLELLEQLQDQIPVRSLECLPEKGAVDCILNYPEGMT